jgi:hypothetical protein
MRCRRACAGACCSSGCHGTDNATAALRTGLPARRARNQTAAAGSAEPQSSSENVLARAWNV